MSHTATIESILHCLDDWKSKVLSREEIYLTSGDGLNAYIEVVDTRYFKNALDLTT